MEWSGSIWVVYGCLVDSAQRYPGCGDDIAKCIIYRFHDCAKCDLADAISSALSPLSRTYSLPRRDVLNIRKTGQPIAPSCVVTADCKLMTSLCNETLLSRDAADNILLFHAHNSITKAQHSEYKSSEYLANTC